MEPICSDSETLATMRFGSALLLFVLAASGTTAAKKPVRIDDIDRRGPSPVHPLWSPDGNSFAYQEHGTIALYDVAQRKAKTWFETATLEKAAKQPSEAAKPFGWQNRRVAQDSFQWFSNSRDMLVAEGGDLFVMHSDGKFDQVTATEMREEDPKLSPDNKSILYRSSGNLFVLDLATRQVRQLTSDGSATLLNGQLDWVYPEELEIPTASWWSPDSKSIAYLQFDTSNEFVYPQTHLVDRRAEYEPERYPQAGTPNAKVRLGVLSLSDGKTVWTDAGNSADILLARVAWLPDSSRVALETMPRLQDALDLLFCNPKTGATERIIHEESKTWINVADNLYFLKSRPEFLWTSERSGFRHIYRYSLNGELLGQLTSGEWQVDTIAAVDEPAHRIYYTSSEASPLETQLYSMDFEHSGTRSIITSAGFDHHVNANPVATYYLDRFSSRSQPPEDSLFDNSGKMLAVVKAADKKALDEFDIQPTEMVQVQAPDGAVLYAKLIKPAGFRSGKKYPVIVDVYGGPQAQSVRNAWGGLNMDQVFAARGYVVWQLDNRGSFGRGHAFEAPLYREMGTHEVADQRLGVEYLIKQGIADPARIGITGWSYGGYMTIHSLLLAPDIFKVGVAGAPVTDWHNYDTIYTERYMGLPEQNAAKYDISSNVKHAAELKGKLLILHNMEDDNVLFQNTVQMVNAFEEAGKQYYLQIYPQRTHGVSGKPAKTMAQAVLDFFDRNL